MKKVRGLEILTYLLYGACFCLNLLLFFTQKDIVNLEICIWIINTTTMFTLYRRTDRFGDERVAWRDDLIIKQNDLITTQNVLIKKLNRKIEENKN